MYSTDVLLFTPRQDVVLIVGNSPRRYQTVYAKNLTLHKGVDNRLQFRFINQEQKPVDISGAEITCRLISSDGTTLLLEKALTLDSSLAFPVTGLAEFQITSGELDSIESQYCFYTLQIPSDSFDVPVFVDSQAGGRGKINIVDSVLPNFEPSVELSLRPRSGSQGTADFASYYYSDVFYPKDSAYNTFVPYLTDYTGTIEVEGLDDTNVAYTIDTISYTSATGPQDPINVTGYFTGIRLKFNNTVDPETTDKVLVR